MGCLVRLSQTRWNYWAGFAVDIGGALVLYGIALKTWDSPWWYGGLMPLGIVLYHLIEYSLHRFGGHGPIRALAEGHWYHHEHPTAYAAMPFFIYPLIVTGLWLGFQHWLPLGAASLLAGAIYGACGYGAIVHHLQHWGYEAALLDHHVYHHDHPDWNFGQSDTWVDTLCRTKWRAR